MQVPFTKEQAAGLPIEHASYSSILQYHSNVQLFVKCYVRKEWNITDTPSAIVGTCGHEFAKSVLQGADELTAQACANVLFDRIVSDPAKKIDWGKTGTPEGSKSELSLLCGNLETAIEGMRAQGFETVSAESEHVLPIRGADGQEYPVPIKAKIDGVFRKDGKVAIVDWKSAAQYSEPGAVNPKYELQAAAYWLVLREFTGVEPNSALFVEVKKKEPSLVCKADPSRKLLQADLRALCEENGIPFGTYEKNADLQLKLSDAGIIVKEAAANFVKIDLSAGYESRPVRAFLALYERFLTDLWYRTNYDLPTLVNVSDEFGKGLEAYEDFLKESGIE